MPRCAASKPDRSPCERIVGASQRYCYAHDPARSEDRRRNASKGGKSKVNRNLSDLDKQLEKLAADTLEGTVERGCGRRGESDNQHPGAAHRAGAQDTRARGG